MNNLGSISITASINTSGLHLRITANGPRPSGEKQYPVCVAGRSFFRFDVIVVSIVALMVAIVGGGWPPRSTGLTIGSFGLRLRNWAICQFTLFRLCCGVLFYFIGVFSGAGDGTFSGAGDGTKVIVVLLTRWQLWGEDGF